MTAFQVIITDIQAGSVVIGTRVLFDSLNYESNAAMDAAAEAMTATFISNPSSIFTSATFSDAKFADVETSATVKSGPSQRGSPTMSPTTSMPTNSPTAEPVVSQVTRSPTVKSAAPSLPGAGLVSLVILVQTLLYLIAF